VSQIFKPVNITSKACEYHGEKEYRGVGSQPYPQPSEHSVPANKGSAVPADADIDGAANLDDVSRMTSALMSALILGTVTPKEGNAKLTRLDKRMNTLERDLRRGVNRLLGEW
jgi:hypothetical protein